MPEKNWATLPVIELFDQYRKKWAMERKRATMAMSEERLQEITRYLIQREYTRYRVPDHVAEYAKKLETEIRRCWKEIERLNQECAIWNYLAGLEVMKNLES